MGVRGLQVGNGGFSAWLVEEKGQSATQSCCPTCFGALFSWPLFLSGASMLAQLLLGRRCHRHQDLLLTSSDVTSVWQPTGIAGVTPGSAKLMRKDALAALKAKKETKRN